MVTRMVTLDDLTGDEEDVKTVGFNLDGADYEIDLGPASRDKLREAIEPFIKAARPVPVKQARTRVRRRSGSSDIDPVAARKWAAEHGIDVAPRGRVPKDVLEAYQAASGRGLGEKL